MASSEFFLALEVISGQLFFNKTWFKLYYIIVEHPRYKLNIQDTITYNASYPGSDSKPRACPKVTSKRLVLLMQNTLYHCACLLISWCRIPVENCNFICHQLFRIMQCVLSCLVNVNTPQPLYNTIAGVHANSRVSYPIRVITRVKCCKNSPNGVQQ